MRFKYSGPRQLKDEKWYPDTWREMSDWCSTAFGCGNWDFYGDRFSFKKESDLMLFLLRWS